MKRQQRRPISVSPFTMAAGDLNTHSSLWDERQPADQRGETVEDWHISRHASILNNGEPTSIEPPEGQAHLTLPWLTTPGQPKLNGQLGRT